MATNREFSNSRIHFLASVGFALLGVFLWGGVLAFGPELEAFGASSTTTVSCTPNPAFINQTTACTATVTGAGTPTGTVNFSNGGKAGTFSSGSCSLFGGSCSVNYTPAAGDAGNTTITASYAGAGGNDPSSGNTSLTVNLRTTSTSISCTPTTVVVDDSISCSVTVTDQASGNKSAPEGTVTIGQTSGSGSSTPCVLASISSDSSNCTTQYTPTDVGNRQVTATYPDGTVHGTSSGNSATITVTARLSQTIVECSETPLPVNAPTQCTASVTDASGGKKSVPTGTVTFSNSPGGQGTLGTPNPCTLDALGQCSVTYTPTNADTSPHTITATYAGDTKHSGSNDSFDQDISLREADVQLNCQPSAVFIDQELTCFVTVADDTTAGTPITPAGSVGFDDAGKVGTFSPTSCTLSSGKCSVKYTPGAGDAGTSLDNTTITATYTPATGPSVHAINATDQVITVHMRPSETTVICKNSANEEGGILFINETGTCTVTVKDLGPAPKTAPSGDVNLSVTTLAPGAKSLSAASCTLIAGTGQSTCTFTYVRTTLPGFDAGIDTIMGDYAGSTTHAISTGAFKQSYQRRETTTAFTSCPTSSATTPVSCTVTVTDTASRGTASTPAGTIKNPADDSVLCTLAAGSCSFNVALIALLTNVTALYDPGLADDVHLKSTKSQNIQSTVLPSAPGGGTNVKQSMQDLTLACIIANAVINGLQVINIAVSLVPDLVVGAGVVVISGTTIKISDIVIAVTSTVQLALAEFTLIACSDTDGDGIYNLLEDSIGTDKLDWDTDDDGLSDGAEVEAAYGFIGTATGGAAARHPKGKHCPDPTDPDSDGDGLVDPTGSVAGAGTSDAYEATFQLTDMCDKDTDDDGKTDREDVVVQGTSALDPDTDDDGLCDGDGGDVDGDGSNACPVHPLSGLVRSEASAGTNPLDPDTDGDEILDGDEDLDGDGVFGLADTSCGTVCTSLGFGYLAEPDPTIFDTDMDDLGDGFELGSGSGCDPSDPDTDDDDLSDSEEVNDTHTTCSNPDSDGDGLSDADEHFVLSGVFPTRDLEQVTDPLIQDTDGDGRNDNLEYSGSKIGQTAGPGQPDACVPGVLPADTGPGFANSFDSDDDGLNDGPDFLLGADVGGSSGNNGELSTDILDSICDPDSDDDGLLDGEEHEIGVDPLDWDSDDDGLGDQEELQTYFTDPNDTDTDDDNADGIIPARDPTAAPVLSGHSNAGTIVCLSDCEEAFSASMQGLFVGEIRDETDPLQKDTDGDGIQDDIEFAPGCNVGAGGTGTGIVLNDGYANSFDSDGDGAHDGVEAGVAGVLAGYPLAAVGSDVAASIGNDGELDDDGITNICDPDSDGDGLLDGDEIGQTLDSATGALPLLGFLDWDSDDDGLSDLEETQIYFTDPELADTDGDLADGVIPSRTPTFSDSAHPALTGHSGAGTIDCKSDCEEVYSGTLLFNPTFVAVPGFPPAPGAAAGFGNPLDETDPLQQDTDGDGINDNIEFAPGCNTTNTNSGSALFDGFANSFDSDADGLRDFEDAVADVFDAASITIDKTPVTRVWASYPETPRPLPGFAKDPSPDGQNDGELSDDAVTGICDPDSDGDGILDGEEHQIGTDIYDWDTDDDGRDDGEFLGEGPIPSDPLDFDTDDDGLGDGVEVFGNNQTNPVVADTDGDGLCDGGATTPASTQFGAAPGPGAVATGGVDGAGSNPLCYTGVAAHPNDGASLNAITPTPSGWGEDINGDGTLAGSETNPNDFDTDDDAVGDGVELLAFYTSRQSQIPAADLFGRTINVVYPMQDTFVCMNPLNPDSDGDGLDDGVEDLNHDGIFDFEPGDFDHAGQGPIPGPAQDNPEETNPCDPDSDDDGLNDFLERNQPNPPGPTGAPQSFYPFNPTNPLDHDTDNDYMLDGEEVYYMCPAAPPASNLDNDNDGFVDEDPLDGVDNDLDGKIDEDGPDFTIFHVDYLDPTNRDSDGDGWIDGLDPAGFGGPCNTAQLPIVGPGTIVNAITDTDNDGFADDDEIAAGTDPFDPNSHPADFFSDLDLDLHSEVLKEPLVDTQGHPLDADDDRLWLEDPDKDGIADSVVIDINADVLVDIRVLIVKPADVRLGDFDGDGAVDDRRYVVVYTLANYRFVQPRVTLVIDDYNSDGVIDRIELSVK